MSVAYSFSSNCGFSEDRIFCREKLEGLNGFGTSCVGGYDSVSFALSIFCRLFSRVCEMLLALRFLEPSLLVFL